MTLSNSPEQREAPNSTKSSTISIRELEEPGDPALLEAYAILAETFHRGERVALRDWISSLTEKASGVLTDLSWHLLVAESNGKVVGLASGTYLGNVNIGVVGYLASTPEVRSKGTGTRLRKRLRRSFELDAQQIVSRPLDAIVGEVSASNPWLRSLARRPEVLVLDFPYFQPRLYEDDVPSPFVLYYESMRGARESIPVEELSKLLYTVWRRIYRISRPLDRTVFRTMLASLEHRDAVGRRPLVKSTKT